MTAHGIQHGTGARKRRTGFSTDMFCFKQNKRRTEAAHGILHGSGARKRLNPLGDTLPAVKDTTIEGTPSTSSTDSRGVPEPCVFCVG